MFVATGAAAQGLYGMQAACIHSNSYQLQYIAFVSAAATLLHIFMHVSTHSMASTARSVTLKVYCR
jgi:hypothetical protein